MNGHDVLIFLYGLAAGLALACLIFYWSIEQ